MTGGTGPTLPAPLRALPGDLPAAVAATPLSGGDIAAVWRVTLADGATVVVKHGPTPAALEAEGLVALRAAGGEVPDVLGHADRTLVLAHVTGDGQPADFGRMLARVHTAPASDDATNGGFGWHRDNVIGPLPQDNTREPHWPTFVAAHRLRAHLDVLPDRPDHRAVTDRLRTAIDAGRVADELDHAPAPALVHGDLWSGNVLGWRWLIDPAVHRADREVDLAMLELFGHLPADFLHAYTEVAPLPDGVGRRRLLYQLVPLLVHVRLFGAGYLDGIRRRLDELGW